MIQDTRKMTEGAMMVAISGLMLFLNRQFGGMIEYMMEWILSFPILLYAAKYCLKDAMIPSVCMILLSFMLGTPTTIFYMTCSVLIGLVYGCGIRKKWKNGKLLVLTFLFTLFSYIITFMLFASLFGYRPEDDAQIATFIMEMLPFQTGVQIGSVVILITFLTTLLMSVLQTICVHLIANILLTRMKIAVHALKPIVDLVLPKAMGIIIIVIWLLFSIQSMLKLNQELSTILLACAITSLLIACAYGAVTLICVCVLVLRKRALLLLVMIGLFVPFVQIGIACIGIWDMLINAKQKMKRGG